jgi:hypothetical protein
MLYVPQVNHGFGWFVDRYHGRRIGQHSGGTPGVSSAIYRFIDDGLSVTLLTNDADRILDQFAIELPACTSPRYAARRTAHAACVTSCSGCSPEDAMMPRS